MQLYDVEIRYHTGIPVRDGLVLSANLFLPVARHSGEQFPAILEMIPYRKDDWRYPADHTRMRYFAERGFVGCRLDIRGTGSSPGIALDEYTLAETQDGYDAVAWLAAQPWCNGNIGMWGISYGGFTAIQVAMMQPPALKAIIPMYATDDRYLDDVHYIGGCLTASECAQYAVAQIAMNALPPKLEYAGAAWADQWKQRLGQTPPWLLEWLRQQTDGPYWRGGSLAHDYTRIRCAIFHIGGWADSYVGSVLRMQEHCVNAPRKALIGPWIHSLPDSAYPAPNVDYLAEMVRFFDFWLKGEANGVMDEPLVIFFRQEYTPPEAFPTQVNGSWQSEACYPITRSQPHTLFLGERSLQAQPPANNGSISYQHRPTHGTHAALCYGAGSSPNGLARDLRPDEALIPTFTTTALAESLDVIGVPEAILYLSCSAPVAHVVVRLTDVALDGTSAHVCTGILNLTHRTSHSEPTPLVPGEIYAVRVPLRAIGYRFLAGHRIRLSVASGYWPVIWPSPFHAEYTLHVGVEQPSQLILPAVPFDPTSQTPHLDILNPEQGADTSHDPASIWQIIEDVLRQSVTVVIAGADVTELPDQCSLATYERLELTAYHHDPAHASMKQEARYELHDHGYQIRVRSAGTLRSTVDSLHVDLTLEVHLNENLFFQRSWIESLPRQLV